MTRKGGLKEVMRGINGGIKRLIKLLTMKYYYHCFTTKPKVPIPHDFLVQTYDLGTENTVPSLSSHMDVLERKSEPDNETNNVFGFFRRLTLVISSGFQCKSSGR